MRAAGVEPPLTWTMLPCIQALRSLATKTTTSAMSAGAPVRPSGVMSSISRIYGVRLGSSARSAESVTRPGETALTRMPCGPSSMASASVSMLMAAFEPQ